MDINEDKLYEDFVISKNYKTSSEISNYHHLNKYFNWIKKTPTKAIDEAEKDEDQRLRMKNRKIKAYLTNYLNFLIKENYSENYIKNAMGNIRTFYRYFDIELPRQTIRLQRANRKFTTDDIIQKKHIQKVLKFADPKWKAIITTMASSGMGSAELRSLTFHDFKNGLKEIGVKQSHNIDQIRRKVSKNRDALIIWQIARVKTNSPYFTFSTPEALSYIIEYLEQNQQYGREYLFTSSTGGKITSSMMTYQFGKLNKLAGFDYIDGKRFFHSHGLRSFFASLLYKAGLPQLTIDFFLGHRIDKVTEAYFKADIPSLRQEYLKIIHEITFTEPVETRIITDEWRAKVEKERELESKRVKELEKTVAELKSILDEKKELEQFPKPER